MRCCSNCEFNDGFIYPTMPPKYKCTITDQYHFGNFDCNLELVPVVRCKDCKYYYVYNGRHFCDLDIEMIRDLDPNYYCADGERREDAKTD